MPAEESETLRMLVDPFEKFMKTENNAAHNDEIAEVPASVTEALQPMGAFGLMVPEQYGGLGLNNTGYARLVEVVGADDLGLGIYLGAHQSIGYKGIVLFGNAEQKERYLPDLASGKRVAAFCLTEPSAGSDAQSIKTRARLSEDGSHWILNGSKIWISNGGIAEVFTVFAQTEVKDEKTGEKKDKVTAFIVERGFGGVTNGPPEKKMGIKCSNTAEVYFDNVKIPKANVIGEVGRGFHIAMEILNNGRFGMGAALSGTMRSCIKLAASHAVQRTQFGRKLRDFELIQGKFAAMGTRLFATESLAYAVAGNMDRGAKDYSLEAACGKIFASEAAWFVADETIQILGGLGFMRAYPAERILRDLRIFRIFEGTNDILRLYVALNGMQEAGKQLKPLQDALKSPLQNLGALFPAAVSIARARAGVPEMPTLAWAPSSLRPAAGAIEEGAAGLGSAVREALFKHGKKIVDQQLILERAASAAIDLTAATAAVARATRAVQNKSPTADLEVSLANCFALDAAGRIRTNIQGLNPNSRSNTELDRLRRDVASALLDREAYPAAHPLGF